MLGLSLLRLDSLARGMTKLLALVFCFLVVAALPESNTADLKELITENVNIHHGKLTKWLDGLEDRSYGMILLGKSEIHYATIQELILQHQYLSRKPIFTVDCKLKDYCQHLMDIVSEHFVSQCIGLCVNEKNCDLGWNTVMVLNSHLAPLSQLNLFAKFFNSPRCKWYDYKVKYDLSCNHVLFVLSTNFGQAYMNQPDNAEEVNLLTNRVIVKEKALQELRKTWSKGALFNKHKKHIYLLLGHPDEQKFQRLMSTQDEERLLKSTLSLQNLDTPKNPSAAIDLNVFERYGFIGQHIVIQQIKNLLSIISVGQKTNNGPTVMLFAGPAGCGKTFLSRLVGSAYHGGAHFDELELSNKFHLFDMGNYQDEQAVNSFVGPNVGIVGEGVLSSIFQSLQDQGEALRPVIVLDEVEKAHPSLLQKMLLPIIDSNHGHIQQKKAGDSFLTKDAVFIMTTNCFDSEIEELHQQNSGYTEAGYHSNAKRIQKLISSPNSQCKSAFHPNTNPFAPSSLIRRLVSGHSLANHYGFYLLFPPNVSQLDQLILNYLEATHQEFQRHGRISHLYYSAKALAHLQKEARAKLDKENAIHDTVISSLNAKIRNHIANYLIHDDGDMDIDSEAKCKCVLYMKNYREMSIKVICDGVDSEERSESVVEEQVEAIEWQSQSESALEPEEQACDTTVDALADQPQYAVDVEMEAEDELHLLEDDGDGDVEDSQAETEAEQIREKGYLEQISELQQSIEYWQGFVHMFSLPFVFMFMLFMWKLLAVSLFLLKIGVLLLSLAAILLYHYWPAMLHYLVQLVMRLLYRYPLIAMSISSYIFLSMYYSRRSKNKEKLLLDRIVELTKQNASQKQRLLAVQHRLCYERWIRLYQVVKLKKKHSTLNAPSLDPSTTSSAVDSK